MIVYRLTPWDTKSLGFKTAEILAIDYTLAEDSVLSELDIILTELTQKEVKFVYVRVDGQFLQLRKILQEKGFYFAECSQFLSKNKIQRYERAKNLPNLSMSEPLENDIQLIKDFARDSFKFSRFHEDKTIAIEKANLRYYNWIDDIRDQNLDIKIFKSNDKIIALSIQENNPNNTQAKLVLAGCGLGSEIYALSLWNEIIDYNKSKGIRKLTTVISASNIGVANIYSYYGFKVDKTLFGFHKYL